MDDGKCVEGKVHKCKVSIKADNGFTLNGTFSGPKAVRIVEAIVTILTGDDS